MVFRTIGIACSLAAALASADAQDAIKIKQPPPARALSAPPAANGNGRFVFGQVNDIRADQYMLDTKTGRMWQMFKRPNSEEMELVPVVYISDDRSSANATPPQ